MSYQEQIDFQLDEDEVRVVLDQYTGLVYHSGSSPKQQAAGRHVAPPGHINLIPSQSVFGLFP